MPGEVAAGFVSVWYGSPGSEADAEAYLEEMYDEDGVMSSPFMTDFRIRWYEADYRELLFDLRISKLPELLAEGPSYINSFGMRLVDAARKKGILVVEAAVFIYDVKYEEELEISGAMGFRFLGAFPYSAR